MLVIIGTISKFFNNSFRDAESAKFKDSEDCSYTRKEFILEV